MHNTELYLPSDEELVREQTACLERLYDYNQTRPGEMEKRTAMLKEMFAEIGDGCYIEPPFHANFGGAHVHFGKNIYANFIFVGEKCEHFFQLNVCIEFRVSSTFGHSRSVSDKPQTMSGLSGVPNGTSSQTI